jgi:DNA replication protein DnaC
MISLSPGQKDVLNKTLTWCKKDKSQSDLFITIGGYAGTGKTTLIAVLRKRIAKLRKNMKVGFVSYTGKAARRFGGDHSFSHLLPRSQ